MGTIDMKKKEKKRVVYKRPSSKGNDIAGPDKKSNNPDGSLCSGYKIFPDDSKCLGCIDCDFGKGTDDVKAVFNRNHTTMIVMASMTGDDILANLIKR
jgi:hypothetical protein